MDMRKAEKEQKGSFMKKVSEDDKKVSMDRIYFIVCNFCTLGGLASTLYEITN